MMRHGEEDINIFRESSTAGKLYISSLEEGSQQLRRSSKSLLEIIDFLARGGSTVRESLISLPEEAPQQENDQHP